MTAADKYAGYMVETNKGKEIIGLSFPIERDGQKLIRFKDGSMLEVVEVISMGKATKQFAVDGCLICHEKTSFKPSHQGSPSCKSGSLASGGTQRHCTCDTCF